MLTIASRHFVANNQPFFYLADTAWNAFAVATEAEWEEYVAYRSGQGFTALQLSFLPILHDASISPETFFPFECKADGSFDFLHLNDTYFQRAERMVARAAEYGLTCAIALLWCNYVPDTWISQQHPEHVMPFDAITPYVTAVVERLKPYHPVYLISGDTDFRSEQTTNSYLKALTTVKQLSPNALTCFHISPYADLPDSIVATPELDFYVYQSGHRREEQHLPYTLAEKFSRLQPARPVINSEPCYEGHGFGGEYGRFHAFDVRKAFWQSILSGASAGFTYGAHGLWSWHRQGATFNNERWSQRPFTWKVALQLPGASDVAFGKWIIERYDCFELVPQNELLASPSEEIRLAMTPDHRTFMIYVPYSVPIHLHLDLSTYHVEGLHLSTRTLFRPRLTTTPTQSTIEMLDANADYLLIGRRLSSRKADPATSQSFFTQ
ncbi:uncharacterized protein DUF4038 [Thermosporothrix hazakensis]|jgi:hypothetical protein|uniref:Uncharacterized protein DUF4038 n=1 Tax=Thermosporothrix hazakensis TaxID=644383 RepID=A0A326U1Z3_THEHA|nr:DUF4038 domain-containing protein [Thermosporothrix hazakensis]PZW25289.1 uncharacterized protein DUF4038 [Thermosporothrix hazakensis]GCE50522.1 beta-glucosidase [Thermosporothrix hazakensis]